MKKPITPLLHGIIDYGFITSLLFVPKLLHVNSKAVNIYRLLGAQLGAYNALTDHGAAVVPLIPFKTHRKVDYLHVGLLALLGLHKDIRKDKTALLFHAAFVSVAALNVLLTAAKEEKFVEEEDEYVALYI